MKQLSRKTNLQDKSGVEKVYGQSIRKKWAFIIVVTILVIISYIGSLTLGSVKIPFEESFKIIVNMIFPGTFSDTSTIYTTIITKDRVYKSALCIIAGFALAISGTMMQGILRNPLVSPFTLGVSSAASFGAAVGIVLVPVFFGTSVVYYDILNVTLTNTQLMRIIFAFVMGLASIGLVIMLSRRSDISKSTIILAGVIISYLFQAGVSFAKYISNDDALRELTYWLMGSMSEGKIYSVTILSPILIVVFILMEKLAPKINTLGAGDDVARSLGINVSFVRNTGLILAALVTSAVTAITGVIGFIGLMAPHICRMFIGNDTRYLLLASGLVGSLVLLLSYIVSLNVIEGQVLPIGIFMDILGGLFFVWLITRRRREVQL